MDIDRRGLIKGALACGGLATLGVGPWAFAAPMAPPPGKVLLLAQVSGAGKILRGARAACVLHTADLEWVDLRATKDLASPERWLFSRRDTTCVAVLPPAAAILLLEAARGAGKPLLWMGSHSHSQGSACLQRHVLSSSSRRHSPGRVLTAQLNLLREKYSYSEHFLEVTAKDEQAFMRQMARSRAAQAWQAGSTLEALGYALTIAALGADAGDATGAPSSSFRRADQQPTPARERTRHTRPEENFFSLALQL